MFVCKIRPTCTYHWVDSIIENIQQQVSLYYMSISINFPLFMLLSTSEYIAPYMDVEILS